jgi:hypothetical protein
LTNQLGEKKENWQNSPPHAEIYVRRSRLASTFLPHAKPGERVEKLIKNIEGFLIQVFKNAEGEHKHKHNFVSLKILDVS